MQVPRAEWDSVEAVDAIKNAKPIVLLNCPLIGGVRWDYEKLADIIDPNFKGDVYESQTRRFLYFDDKHKSDTYKFKDPTTKTTMKFKDFVNRVEYLRNHHSSSSMSRDANSNNSPKTNYIYYQQSVVQEMGPKLLEEFMKFSLETALKFKIDGNWDSLSSNLLLCGPEGVLSPIHYDEQHNLFAQLSGVKRVRLFPPDDFIYLYPYPLNHPCDRHARLTLPDVPGSSELISDKEKFQFPEFTAEREMYVDLAPGELLYIPQYYWHQMESLTDNVSMSWWYKDQLKNKNVKEVDFSKVQNLAVARNLERLVGSQVGGGKIARDFFLAVASGKLPIPSDATGVIPDLKPPLEFDKISSKNVKPLKEWSNILQAAIEMSALVLKPGAPPKFFADLVRGRFGNFDEGLNV